MAMYNFFNAPIKMSRLLFQHAYEKSVGRFRSNAMPTEELETGNMEMGVYSISNRVPERRMQVQLSVEEFRNPYLEMPLFEVSEETRQMVSTSVFETPRTFKEMGTVPEKDDPFPLMSSQCNSEYQESEHAEDLFEDIPLPPPVDMVVDTVLIPIDTEGGAPLNRFKSFYKGLDQITDKNNDEAGGSTSTLALDDLSVVSKRDDNTSSCVQFRPNPESAGNHREEGHDAPISVNNLNVFNVARREENNNEAPDDNEDFESAYNVLIYFALFFFIVTIVFALSGKYISFKPKYTVPVEYRR